MLVVTDKLDDNVFLSSRNLPDVLVLETREVDPVSLVRFNNVLLTKARRRRNSRRCWDERHRQHAKKYNPERLMTVLLAPVVSEKGTYIADKHEQVIFRVAPDATKPEVKAAVELMFKVEVESVQIVERQGQGEALRPLHRPAPQLEEGLRLPEAGPGNQLRGGGLTWHSSKSNRHRRAAARWSRSSTRTCTRARRSTR